MSKKFTLLCLFLICAILFAACEKRRTSGSVTTKIHEEVPSPATESTDMQLESSSAETQDDSSSTETLSVDTSETAETASASLEILNVTSPVAKSHNATLNAKGKPNTVYSIKVLYPSGASAASGLADKTSDDDGYVSWSWKVGGSTTAGEHTITVSGGGESVETSFVTTE